MTTPSVFNPAGFDVAWQIGVEPLDLHTDHAAPDSARVTDLAADMAVRGWAGPPVVVWGNRAYTGTHRIHAWRQATDDPCAAVPCVELADLLAVADLDLAALDGDREVDQVVQAVKQLPGDLAAAYGLDLEG
ncbi:hypothetical protein AB0I28_32590 [Phytomonospora sp. NPDC050363]|uniref:hypothetical protein n=1 Tax=Phytomonospora sp. NPDC050363 TaxID=3155642 RepID=UPI0033DC162D